MTVLVPPLTKQGRGAAYFLRAYAGAPVTRTLRPSLLRCGERPCDTLRALPENVAAPRGSRWARLYAIWRVHGGFGGLRSDIRVPELCEGGFPVGAKEECGRLRSPAWEDGIARSDIRVSEAKRGRVPL